MSVVLLFVLGFVAGRGTSPSVEAQGGAKQAPIFEVDPYWPKPPTISHNTVPNLMASRWMLQDNVWTHPPAGDGRGEISGVS